MVSSSCLVLHIAVIILPRTTSSLRPLLRYNRCLCDVALVNLCCLPLQTPYFSLPCLVSSTYFSTQKLPLPVGPAAELRSVSKKPSKFRRANSAMVLKSNSRATQRGNGGTGMLSQSPDFVAVEKTNPMIGDVSLPHKLRT